ncbi:MFS transporter, partial [Acinetobacter nectaris]|nr:MFS transporter [Acinetobacter nectaris]
FFYSQFLIAFANGVFIGPLLLTGMGKTLQQGSTYVVTFIVLFSATQNFGSLIGSSFYNTYQKHQAQVYQVDIDRTMNATDPNVINRINQYKAKYTADITDPLQVQGQAIKSLAQIATRESQVRAYNDVINLNSWIAIILFIWTSFNIFWDKFYASRKKNA